MYDPICNGRNDRKDDRSNENEDFLTTNHRNVSLFEFTPAVLHFLKWGFLWLTLYVQQLLCGDIGVSTVIHTAGYSHFQ